MKYLLYEILISGIYPLKKLNIIIVEDGDNMNNPRFPITTLMLYSLAGPVERSLSIISPDIWIKVSF